MIVVDANVVAYFVIPGPHTTAVQNVRKKDRNWVTPFLSSYELLSSTAKDLDRQLITRDEGAKYIRRAMHSVDIRYDVPDALEIFKLHQSSGCTTYDCIYIAMARKLRCPLITVDGKLLSSFPGEAKLPEHF